MTKAMDNALQTTIIFLNTEFSNQNYNWIGWDRGQESN